jgi:polysaccharide deacetylase 2 family uncharacterized protein YibQ
VAALALVATLVVLALMLLGPFPSPFPERQAAPKASNAPVAAKKKPEAPKPAVKTPAPSAAPATVPAPGTVPAPATAPAPGQDEADALTLAKALSQAKAQATRQPPLVHFEEHLPPQAGLPENGNGNANGNGHNEVRGRVEPPTAVAPPLPPEPAAQPVARDAGKSPRMVVVIDDIGDHPAMAKNLTELPFPVTLAILPNRPRTRSVEAMAAAGNVEIILHQPMQPGTYPRVNPGPGALFIDMEPQRVKEILIDNLAQLPHVKGVNNHMGSTFTSNPEGMDAVMAVLKDKGLFFLDSVTSATSAAPEAARQHGVPFYRRAVFLDNARNVRTILGQLKTAERSALKNGRAIAIGHPYGETLEALKIWAKERDSRIEVVTLSELGPEF